ncbi:type 1 periplasmic binding fold superfamily protein [Tenacibaculum insulae]|uniref:type 1 periplasmic binding fold superfamily protein n=1 Tax=Tenacibaculum insulae TaxID=2029677 RepID=UPI003AB476A4
MKKFKLIALLFISSIVVTSCSDDDTPEHIHEEEVITTMKVVLTPTTGPAITIESRDLDGDGPDVPVITEGILAANTTYSAVITLLNETESTPEDITEEVAEEAEEHQFFYKATTIASTFTYEDNDLDGNPIGINFTVQTADAGTGSYTITLKHEPNKSGANVKEGDITNAGGETDIEVVFPITVQ